MHAILIQFRKDADMCKQELDCYLRFSGLKKDELTVVHARKDGLKEKMLEGADALLLGSTGRGCIVREDGAFLEACKNFLRLARSRHIPMLGINYGAHLLTICFGGSVTHDSSRREVGSCMVQQQEAAKADPIFRHLPLTFNAQMAHVDVIATLPLSAVHLLTSDLCTFEAWAFPQEGIYAVEFQADTDEQELAERLVNYKETYADEPGGLEHVMMRLHPSPDATRVIPLFFKEVVEKRAR